MALPFAQVDVDTVSSHELTPSQEDHVTKTTTSPFSAPLKYSGSLDSFEQFDVTAVIGREFPKLQLSQIIDDDARIRDLAVIGDIGIEVSERYTNT
jgi:hypothetical protein